MQLSVWEKETFFEPQDIIIIGSGLAGLWSAYEMKLKNKALKITIFEKGIIPSGASTRNAGFACFGSPSELLHDVKIYGENKMWQIAEMRYKGMQKINRVFKDDFIDYEICGGYEVYNSSFDKNELQEGIAWLNKGLKEITGIEKCFTQTGNTMEKFGLSGFESMVENKLEGYLHSGKLLKTLLSKVQSLGVQIFTGIEVTGWQNINDKMVVHTQNGIDCTTEKLLICSNAFTSNLLPGLNVVPARGQIILTSPIENLKLKGAFHYDEGFYYFRNLGNKVLLGGARNKAFSEEQTTEMVTSEIVQDQLEQFLKTQILSGNQFTIEQRWSGIMSFTESKEPIVKRIHDNVVVAIACNGMGVALTPVIAEKVCEMMC